MTAISRVTGSHPTDGELVRALAGVFRDARRANLQFLIDLHGEDEDRRFLSTVVLPDDEVYIAEVDGAVAGFIAFAGGWVHHLYVTPRFQRRGLGRQLLALAKSSIRSLQLWAFEANAPAIAFYQREGFHIVQRTDGVANEARMPDVRMEWTAPAPTNPAQ
jgi:GNAT superfamily N-acetyltransferase